MPTDLLDLRVGKDDMINLEELTQDSLHNNLEERYNANLIYTYTGSILVSINPYQNLPIYSLSHCRKYADKKIGELPPHIFALADNVFTHVREYGKNQCVIISGESGAGKTEATKLILQFLSSRMIGKHSEIERKILESSPILEAFGNAKTVRNNNSSRFGKFMEIHFDKNDAMCGTKIQQYLLEKSRIVSQNEGERNYHCFYYLCLGASPEEKEQMKLDSPDKFHYLNQGTTILDGTTDESTYQEKLKGSMATLGFSPSEIKQISLVLAAILHIGQIKFAKAPKGEGSVLSNPEEGSIAGELLTVQPEVLKQSLIQRINFIRNEKFTTPLTPIQSAGNRDALSKLLYSRLFAWLVERINKCIVKTAPTKAFIGILDIFGFERFKVNSFEQFCINWTNEAMQCSFTHHIFALEQEEYEREGVDFSKITYTDNKECINLIEAVQLGKGTFGLAKMLDDELKMPKSTDFTFLEKVRTSHKDHPFYHHDKLSKSTFGVKHYAGVVNYEVDGFLEKNADTIQEELVTLLLDSQSTLLGSMFEKEKKEFQDAQEQASSSKGSVKGPSSSKAATHKITVASFFRKELRNLIETLDNCNAHYVRCIKPNPQKLANNWDAQMVLDQLAYSGMLDTIRIRKAGFPFRTSHIDFFDRYRCIAPAVRFDQQDPGKAVVNLLQAVQWDPSVYAQGKTKIFFKEGQIERLDSLRKEALTKVAITIQAFWRGVSAHRHFEAQKKAVVVFQKYARRWTQRNKFLRIQAANIMGQSVVRTWLARKKYEQSKQAISNLQSVMRTFLAQEELADLAQKEKERLELLAKMEEEERKRVEEERIQKIREEEERKRKEAEEKKVKEEEEQRLREEQERKLKEENEEKQRQELGLGDEFSMLQQQMKRAPSRKNLSGFGQQSSTGNSFLNLPPPQPEADLPVPDLSSFLGEVAPPPPQGAFDIMDVPPPLPDFGSSGSSFMKTPSRSGSQLGKAPSRTASALPKLDELPSSGASKDPSKAELSLEDLGNIVDRFDPQEIGHKTLQEELLENMVGDIEKDVIDLPVDEEPLDDGPKQLRPYGGVIQNVWEDPPEITLPEEVKNFSWKSYALKFLSKARPSKMKLHFKDPWAFSTHRPEGDFFHDLAENAQKVGEDLFNLILSYMGDKKTKEKPYDLAYSITQKGLTTPELRDEIYAILLRQTTGNPNAESLIKGWQLLSVVCCIFPPTGEVFKKTVGAFLLSAIANESTKRIAQFSYQRLRRTLQTGPRRLPPSSREYDMVLGFAPITAQVRFMDGRAVGFLIDSSSNVAEAMESIVDRIGLKNATGFGLFECFNSIQKKFKEENILADSISKAESLSRQHKQPIDHYFLFKKCAFTDIKLSFDDPVERELIYGQIHENVLSDELPVSEEVCIALASLDLQITVGDWSQERSIGPEFLEQLLPPMRYAVRDPHNWIDLISKAHQAQLGRTREECMLDYLKFCQQLPLYGAEVFVGVSWNKQQGLPPPNFLTFPDIFNLAVNVDGVYFLTSEQKVLYNIKFSQIEDYKFLDQNTFYLDIQGATSSLYLNMDGLSLKLDTVLGDYTYFLQLDSNWARAIQSQTVFGDPNLLEFSEGDIIWIKERDPSGWWIGENAQTQAQGSFPAEYVEILVGSEATESLGLREITQEDFDQTNLTKEEINQSMRRSRQSTRIPVNELQSAFSANSRSTLKINKIDHGGSKATIKSMSSLKESKSVLGTIRQKLSSKKEEKDTASYNSSASFQVPHLELPDTPLSQSEAISTLRLRQKDSTMKRKAVAQEGRLEYAKAPIKDSLLDLPSALNKIAVSMFQSIMKYMGDYPAGKTSEHKLVEEILKMVLSNPELRDELYTQICKQITKNPKKPSETRGYQLLAIMAGFITPQDQTTLNFLHSMLTAGKGNTKGENISVISESAEMRLKETLNNGSRRNPCTKQEYEAMITGSSHTLRVYFIDGTTTATYINSQTTVKDMINNLNNALNNYEGADLNGLFQVDITNESVLPLIRSERMADYLYDWKKSLKKQNDNIDRYYRLLFKRQFVLNPKDDLMASEQQLNQFFNQACSDIKTGNMPVDRENALMYAALQLQAVFDDNGEPDPSRLDKNGLLPYFPRPLIHSLAKDKSLVTDFNTVYSSVRTETAEKCKHQLLAKALTNPTYGAVVFRVGLKSSKKTEKNLLLVLAQKSMILFHAGTTNIFHEFNYLDIAGYGVIPNQDQFVIEVGSLLNPEKYILSGSEVNFLQDTLSFYKNFAEKN